jgi:hypothetical protein
MRKVWLTYRLEHVTALRDLGRQDYAAAKLSALACLATREKLTEIVYSEDLVLLGAACLGLADLSEARAHYLDALEHVGRTDHDMAQIALANINRGLGQVELAAGDLNRAEGYYHAALRHALIIPDYNHTASALGRLAEISARHGQAERAAMLAGASHSLYARQGRDPWEASALDALLPGWHGSPERLAIERAYETGRATNAEAAATYALAHRSS